MFIFRLVFLVLLVQVPHALAGPTTIHELFGLLKATGSAQKADLLAALPEEMKRNFVLVSNSRSRQMGSPDLPRVLHFSKNAELIVSSSGHTPEDDIAANDLEVMELNRVTGQWRMGMIHFENGKLADPVINHRSCIACHGDNPRPIWGEYSNWPDAYGGNPLFGTETMGPEERANFLKFVDTAKTHEAYRHLFLRPSEKSYQLTNTLYELPNTVFTSRLGQRSAESIYLRMKHAPAYGSLRLALLAANRRICADNAGFLARVESLYSARLANDSAFSQRWSGSPPQLAITKILRLLDLDPFADFRLDKIPRLFDPKQTEQGTLEWNMSSDFLISFVSFLVLKDAADSDSNVRELLSSRLSEIDRAQALTLASSSALLALDQEGSRSDYLDSVFPYVETRIFRTAIGSPDQPNAACEYFGSTL